MFPSKDWNRYLVSDQVLSYSYDFVGDVNRSWIKKFIAYLFSYYGHDSRTECVHKARERAGFVHERVSSPVPGVAVLADSHFKNWNRLLASVIPAAAAGTADILVFLIKNHEQPCPEILAALELAGVENIFLIDQQEIRSVAGVLSNARDAAIIDLCSRSPVEDIFAKHPDNNHKYIRLFFDHRPRALVWTERDTTWDYDTLKWAHPDVEFTVSGPLAGKAPSGFTAAQAELHQLPIHSYDLFLGPGDIFRSTRIARGFSRGMEPFWLWPEIDRNFFMINRVYWKEI